MIHLPCSARELMLLNLARQGDRMCNNAAWSLKLGSLGKARTQYILQGLELLIGEISTIAATPHCPEVISEAQQYLSYYRTAVNELKNHLTP